VLSDIYAAADRREVTLLGLLDLSSAFDCVDHDVLIERLQQSFGIHGNVLAWIRSFVHEHCQQVAYKGQLSAHRALVRSATRLCPRSVAVSAVHGELFDVIAPFVPALSDTP